MDWTVKLWRAKARSAPVHSFEESDDYVYDVKWHPQHPAMFGTVDGTGKFDLWNLNKDTEVSYRRSCRLIARFPCLQSNPLPVRSTNWRSIRPPAARSLWDLATEMCTFTMLESKPILESLNGPTCRRRSVGCWPVAIREESRCISSPHTKGK